MTPGCGGAVWPLDLHIDEESDPESDWTCLWSQKQLVRDSIPQAVLSEEHHYLPQGTGNRLTAHLSSKSGDGDLCSLGSWHLMHKCFGF